MSSSLVPEKPLVISPSLAATIGLDEAALLHTLHEAVSHRQTEDRQGYCWLRISAEELLNLLPFWNVADLQRVINSLRDTGILLIESAPLAEAQQLYFAINEKTARSSSPTPAPTYSDSSPHSPSARQNPGLTPKSAQAAPGKTLMPPNWQPDSELIKQLAMQGVPQDFVLTQVPEFVLYWKDRFEAAYSWNSKFRSQVIRKWREREAHPEPAQPDQSTAMTPDWQPSLDAMDLLVRHSGIDQEFIEDAIPEFVFYWQELGARDKAWNNKFVAHIKRQWAKFTSAMIHDTEPRRIPANWQPSNDVYDILQLANIDLDFARQLLPEFVVYWRDSNELQRSWNSKFLQSVKFQWAKQHQIGNQTSSSYAGRQGPDQQSSTRSRSLSDDLSDRSWAG